ncbi:MAG: hypothetical protein WC594_11000, partial [Thermodesulfovibrionales bacterium]
MKMQKEGVSLRGVSKAFGTTWQSDLKGRCEGKARGNLKLRFLTSFGMTHRVGLLRRSLPCAIKRDCGVYPEPKPRLLRLRLAMTARDLLAMTRAKGLAMTGWILLFFFFFHCSLFSVHCSLSYAESLSDIKLASLQSPIKVVSEKWGRDPFVRYEDKVFKKANEAASKEEIFLDLKLDGIIADGKKAVAIINGGFYRKNERVNGFLIVAIGKD